MGVVKYTGPMASFHCPTNAEIRSLKVHFSPKQEGSGDPSPENVRPIVGWDGVEQYYSGKNMVHIVGYSATSHSSPKNQRLISNTYGTTINTIDYVFPDTPLIITQEQWPETNNISHYKNGYIAIELDNLIFGVSYDISFKVTNITSNPLNATLQDLKLGGPNGTRRGPTEIRDNILIYKNFPFNQRDINPQQMDFDLRICGMSFTLSDFMVTPANMNDGIFEPYQGSITNYEFGVLGKNKLNTTNITHNNYNFGGIPNTLSPNTIYTYSINGSPTYKYRLYLSIGDNAGTIALNSSYLSGGQNATFTTPSDISSYPELVLAGNTNGAGNEDFSTLSAMIELGSTATTYEPYDPNHTVYGGWVDLISGEVCEEWINFPLISSLNWHKASRNSSGVYFYYENNNAGEQCLWSAGQYQIINAREKYTHGKVENSWSEVGNNAWAYWATNNTTIRLSYSDNMNILSVDDLKNWLDEQGNVSICYPLATPNTYHLAPSQLQTFLGQNNVWSNADYVEVEYDLHETQNILNRKNFIIANQPHIVTPAAAPLQNFVTDVPAPLKECKVHFAPVQDLHGYDKPWVGGSGKNLWNNENIIYGTWTASDGTISAVEPGCRTQDIIASAGNTYTIFYNEERPYSASIIELDENKNFILRTHKQWSGASSPSALTVTMSNDTKYFYAQVYNIDTSAAITPEILATYKIQLEKGSTATSYEPYENICPIEGWDAINIYFTKKSLVQFKTEQREASGYYNGYTGWFDKIPAKNFPVQTQLVYSVYLDCTNSISENERRAKIWIYTKQGTVRYALGNQIDVGNVGISITTVTIQDTDDTISFGLGMSKGTIASQPMVELGNTATTYEPYNGTTIPITFPATTNLFNEQWAQGNIEVGNDAGSSTSMRTDFINVNPSTSYYLYTSRENNVFVFEYLEDGTYADKVNSVHTSHTFTTGSTTKKIRIVDRNSGTETVNTGINYPATITYYEPYGTIYGGYVDLVAGKIVQTHKSVVFDGSESGWSTYKISHQIHFYRIIPDKKVGIGTSISSIFPNVKNISFWDNETYSQYGDHNSLNRIYVNAPYKMPNGVSEWQEWLSNNPMQLVYELATPIEYDITPEILKTLRGTNNIWSNANGDIQLKYWTH